MQRGRERAFCPLFVIPDSFSLCSHLGDLAQQLPGCLSALTVQ